MEKERKENNKTWGIPSMQWQAQRGGHDSAREGKARMGQWWEVVKSSQRRRGQAREARRQATASRKAKHQDGESQLEQGGMEDAGTQWKRKDRGQEREGPGQLTPTRNREGGEQEERAGHGKRSKRSEERQ